MNSQSRSVIETTEILKGARASRVPVKLWSKFEGESDTMSIRTRESNQRHFQLLVRSSTESSLDEWMFLKV